MVFSLLLLWHLNQLNWCQNENGSVLREYTAKLFTDLTRFSNIFKHFPTPGLFPSFWHARGFLSEYNYTEDITGKKSRLAHLSRTGGVKACSRFYACISSLLIKPDLHSETRELSTWINVFWLVNQISVDIIWRTDRRSWNWLMHKAISLLFCFALFLLGMKTLLKLGVNEWNQAIGIIFNWVWRSLQKHPFLLAKEKRMFSQARCDETGHKSESSPKITRSIDRQTQENRYIKKML